jgi:hypothetical protein
MSQNVSQRQDQFTIVAHNLGKVHFVIIGHYLDNRSKDETKDDVDHGHVWQLGPISAQESASLVVVLLAGVGDMGQILRIRLHGEVTDGLSVKIHVRLLVDGLKSELIQIVRPSEFLIFEHFPGFIVGDYHIFGLDSAIGQN